MGGGLQHSVSVSPRPLGTNWDFELLLGIGKSWALGTKGLGPGLDNFGHLVIKPSFRI